MPKSGLEVLNTVPLFKYTDNLERQLFIQEIYPYYDFFMLLGLSVNKECKNYQYEGINDIFNDNELEGALEPLDYLLVSSNNNNGNISRPYCVFFGGCVYEILYKKYGNNTKYNNVDLHRYCDATGDIDIKLFFPELKLNRQLEDPDIQPVISFFNRENKINPFFRDFTSWVFDLLVYLFTHNELISNEDDLNGMFPNIVDFDIDEYDHIPDEFKHDDYGFKIQRVGKFYVIAFLEGTMFKIQIVCKVVKNGITVIDHLLEFVCSNFCQKRIGPYDDHITSNLLGNDTGKLRDQIQNKFIKKINFSRFEEDSFYIQSYTTLIYGNVSGYKDRHKIIGEPNNPIWKGKLIRHKAINHVARIFYLFELFYQNEELLNSEIINERRPEHTNFLLYITNFSGAVGFTVQLSNWLNTNPYFHYYKIINGNYHMIKVSFKTFFLAYLNILSMKARNNPNREINTNPYNTSFEKLLEFLKKNRVNFIPENIYKQYTSGNIILDVVKLDRLHEMFIEKIFNNEPYENIHPDMSVSKIQTFWKKNKTRKNHKLFKSDMLLSRYTVSDAITESLNKFEKIKSNKLKIKTENSAAKKIQKLFKTKRNISKIHSHHRKESSAAKKIQRKFRSFTHKKR